MESSQEKLKRCQNNSAMNSRKTLLSKKKMVREKWMGILSGKAIGYFEILRLLKVWRQFRAAAERVTIYPKTRDYIMDFHDSIRR